MTNQLSLFDVPALPLQASETTVAESKIMSVEIDVEAEQDVLTVFSDDLERITDEVETEPDDDESPRCVKCQSKATVYSPRVSGYCLEHSTCRCGESVEYFVPWLIGKQEIYVCPCVVQASRDLWVLQKRLDLEKAERLRRLRA